MQRTNFRIRFLIDPPIETDVICHRLIVEGEEVWCWVPDSMPPHIDKAVYSECFTNVCCLAGEYTPAGTKWQVTERSEFERRYPQPGDGAARDDGTVAS